MSSAVTGGTATSTDSVPAESLAHEIPLDDQPITGQAAVDPAHRAVEVGVVAGTDRAERAQVEVGVAELQRVERPTHRRATVGQAPVALLVLQGDTESGASIVGIDGQIVRVQHVRLIRGEPVDRADQPVAVERSDRHAAFADRWRPTC